MEETHNNLYELCDKIEKKYIAPFYAGDEPELVKNITHVFENTRDIKIFLVIERRTPTMMEGRGKAHADELSREITLTIINPKLSGSLGTLRHEMVHVLDYLSSDLKGKNVRASYDKDHTAYLMDNLEFNQFIHNYKLLVDLIAIDYKKVPADIRNMWNKVVTKNDFIEFCSKAFNASVGKSVKENKHLYRRLLQRLAREKLLPPNFSREA